MMLLPEVIFEFAVGGERMEMSMAVPRRRGTRGVNSRATSGRSLWRSSFWLVTLDARSENASTSAMGVGDDSGTGLECEADI